MIWKSDPLLVDGPCGSQEAPMTPGRLFEAAGLPAAWHFYLLSVGAMLALAGLDFVGAVFAKEWAERQHAAYFFAGLLTFGVLFGVYAASLRVAELSTVTFGWVVLLQVGLLVLERFRYGVELPPGKWAAIAAILALQAYLILAPNSEGA